MKQLSIKQNMLWNSLGSLINLGCTWLISVLIVRLSTDYYTAGVYSLAISVYGIFSAVGQYRMYTYQISDVTNENTTGEYFTFRLITAILSIVLSLFYAVVTCSPSTLLAIALYAVYKALCLCLDVLHACDQRNNRMDVLGISLALQGVVSLVLFAIVFCLTQSLELTLIGMTVGVALVGLFYTYPQTRAFGPIQVGITLQKAKYLFIHCLPIVLAALAASATGYVPRQYLAAVMGEEALGIYASVAAPVAIIQMGASYIYNPLMGYFAQRYAAKDRSGFIKIFLLATFAIVLIGIVCAIVLQVAGRFLLVLVYGDSIAEYTYLLIPLVFLAFLTGYQWFINDLLISLRNFKSTFVGSLLPLLTVLVAMVPAVKFLGMNGITFASMAACLVSIAYMIFSLFKQLKDYFDTAEND